MRGYKLYHQVVRVFEFSGDIEKLINDSKGTALYRVLHKLYRADGTLGNIALYDGNGITPIPAGSLIVWTGSDTFNVVDKECFNKNYEIFVPSNFLSDEPTTKS